MKKSILMIIAVFFMIGCLTSCGRDKEPADRKSDKLQIVTTIFPEYDWVRNILGDNPAGAQLTLLLDNGVDMHSFQPSVEDVLKISDCDLFIYVGGESDEWVEDTLKEAVNKDMIVINLLDVLGDKAKEEESVPGIESKEEEADGAYDEHVWLSLKNAEIFTESITKALQSLDEDHKDLYAENSEAYLQKLHALDQEYSRTVSESKVKTLLFGDRFPFRYFTEDYGLSYYAAFDGCSSETEASFETITYLAGKVDELSLHCVLTIEGSDHRLAETIIENTKTRDQKILTMDSMQSVTSEDVQKGTTYISIMKDNLNVLKEAQQ